ncbi:USP6 N-terminal-like protein isoform X2 [Uranotaenia lowii]|uniref:USP6 N-terminal-like protein isoform X2 n=1 Tax=Uranotaenia lowii TaxID=190385 RepID=UPI002479F273|nr:USP6 N-terminal-like protein isoform X2 [Uranotaenia lowii]
MMSEDDISNKRLLLERANAERESIFKRYDRGRKDIDIDFWDDPAFKVYTQADRYGFLHPEKEEQATDDLDEIRRKHVEVERCKKWLKMLKSWTSTATKDRLQRRVLKGVPDRMRSVVWSKMLNLEQMIRDNAGVYDKMLKFARQYSPDIRQIDFDVNRQFRNHINYRERYSVKQQSLFRVLAAYSMYNMEVGYCQGMSTVAAVLLMYFDEEDTFWALNALLSTERYAMHALYVEGFPKLMRFLQHHDKILTKCLPKVKKHLDKHGVDSVLYSLKWFFVIFIERIPFGLCLRVWDIYMLYGERVLTAMAYTILKIHKNKLLRMKDMDQITEFLQTTLHKDFGHDDDTVIKNLQLAMIDLKKLNLDKLPAPPATEGPKYPFGQFIEPSLDQKIGHRHEQFTEKETELKEIVLHRSESKDAADDEDDDDGLENEQRRRNGDAVEIVDIRVSDGRDLVNDEDDRTERDCDDITEDTISNLHTAKLTPRLRRLIPLNKGTYYLNMCNCTCQLQHRRHDKARTRMSLFINVFFLSLHFLFLFIFVAVYFDLITLPFLSGWMLLLPVERNSHTKTSPQIIHPKTTRDFF